jgi:ligand-binding SRPBCC domain-containing protein
MAIYTLRRTTRLPVPPEQAWAFFSDPRNLPRLTPEGMGFRVVSELPAHMYAGMMIEYRVCPVAGIPLRWLTEITHVRDGAYFVDEQRCGPYALWHHEHHFRPQRDGGTEMEDVVTYVPPFGVLGRLAHPLLIAPRLRRIFDYRAARITELFAAADRADK